MAKRLTAQLDEALRDLDRDARYVNDAIEVGNIPEARRFLHTLKNTVATLDVVLTKMEKTRG